MNEKKDENHEKNENHEKDEQYLPLPLWMRPMVVITIRDERYQDFLNRVGALWQSYVVKWPGTVGNKIDRDNWAFKQKIRTHCRLTPGQLGCYDSHVHVWQNCVRSQTNLFVVEDDANLSGIGEGSKSVMDTMNLFWQRLEAWKQTENTDWDFLYIGHHNKKPKTYITNFLDEPNIVIPHGCQGLFAYVITPRGAAFLLEGAVPYEQPIDIYVQHRMENDKANEFRCYAMYPSPFYVVACQSDTRAK
jgi:GR25 family glycosyltransferase involved in LPS biosynthesis